MAKPIKETPILYGEDARRFLEAMKPENQRKVSPEELKEIRENAAALKAIAKFK